MTRPSGRALLAGLVLALAAAAPAFAQADDIRALDKKFREVAARATPATVLVKCTLGDGRTGFGSGATISADGYILTCSHVVDTAADVEVAFASGETFGARLLGKNPKQDYALLKVDLEGLPHFKIGDSTKVALGQWVVALGHPGGPYPDMRPAFSIGRVTGLHRRLPVQMMDRYYDDAIRTDAPIFAGNSGGPLLNLEGELIGLNGAILLINENSYAVPMQEIAPNLARLKAGEQIAGRSADGMGSMPMDEFEGRDLARFLGRAGRRLFGRDGLGKLVPGEGPERDEIARVLERLGKSLEGERAQRMLESLFDQFAERGRGGDRGGGPEMPELPEIPDFDELRKRIEGFFGQDGERGEGERPAGARPPSPAAFLGVVPASGPASADDLAGVEVLEIVPGSPAAKAGLRAGDLVQAVGKTRIERADDLRVALDGRAPGDRVRVRYLRPRAVGGVFAFEAGEVEVALAPRSEEGGK